VAAAPYVQNSKVKDAKGKNSKTGDAIAISGLEYQWEDLNGEIEVLLCPEVPNRGGRWTDDPFLDAQRRFMVRRFLATARFIGLRFAFALVFTAALAISMPSLSSSLSVRISSNLRTLNKFRRLVDSKQSFTLKI
jgi:hypothetical protein